jgi:hypothetical protein
MTTYTKEQLNEIQRKHLAWLRGDIDGSRAVLRDAVLRDADLSRADLSGADLSDADLSGAVLSRADLRDVKEDFHKILDQYPNEVPGLLAALRAGNIDGSTYSGECACLVGTIAKVKCISVDDLEQNASRPAERWFLNITPGVIPHPKGRDGGVQVATITEGWLLEWQQAQLDRTEVKTDGK